MRAVEGLVGRRLVGVASVVAVLTAACASDPESSPGAIADPEASELPTRWVGARSENGEISVTVAATGDSPRSVAAIPAEPDPESGEMAPVAVDIGFDPERNLALLATCCEPASGTVRAVKLNGHAETEIPMGQGVSIDLVEGGYIRSDGFGVVATRADAESPVGEGFEDLGASAVALSSLDGAVRFAVLVDTGRLQRFIPAVSARPPQLILGGLREGERIGAETYSLEGEESYCHVAFVQTDRVGLLRAAAEQSEPWLCVGSVVDVLDLESGSFTHDVIAFPEPVRHLSTDHGASYLIYTTVSGAVGWHSTAEDQGGELAPDGYQAADW